MPFIGGEFVSAEELDEYEERLSSATQGTATVRLRYEVEVSYRGALNVDVDLAAFEVWFRDNMDGEPVPSEKNLSEYLGYEPGLDTWEDMMDLSRSSSEDIEFNTVKVEKIIKMAEGVRPDQPKHDTQVPLDIEMFD